MTNIKNQRGAALLFALGILSLILVMGLAFLGNSLITQKIAFNSQESSSAKVFARNVVDRALAQLTLVNLLQSGQFGNYYNASDASSVFSRLSADPVSAAGNVTTGYQLAAFSKDLLAGDDSKLNVDKKFNTPWYAGKESRARWIYVHRDGLESDGARTDQTSNPIIARYAYQVLPQTSKSKISLYGVTSGVSQIAGVAPAASNPRIPHNYRWGMDVDELVIPGLGNMFSTYWGSGAVAVSPQYEFDNFFNLLSGTSTPNPFYGNTRDIENRKRWVKNMFTEGKGRVAREAYRAGSLWYPRFNLSVVEPYFSANAEEGKWYSRFLTSVPGDAAAEKNAIDTLKNSSTVVDRVGAAPPAGNAEYEYRDSNVKDRDYDHPAGLAFLRRIGNDGEKGAFDTVANLRKQIAANLNDYCDTDYIPTSNVPAVKPASGNGWVDLIKATTGLPDYTGNEKTPYINEIGFGFRIGNTSLNSGSSYTFKTDVNAEVLVELIRIYRELAKKNSTTELSAADFSFKSALYDLGVTLKVTLKGTASYYAKDAGGNEQTIADGVSLGDGVSAEGEAKLVEATSPYDLIVGRNGFTGNGPYWVKNIQLPNEKKVTLTVDLTSALETKGKAENAAAFNGKTVSRIAVNVSDIKVEITKISFNLGNMVLFAPDPADNTKDAGVDFVKVQYDSTQKREAGPALVLYDGDKSGLDTALGTDKYMIAYCSSMEVRDPRQNLNALLLQDDKSEWWQVREPSVTLAESLTNPHAETAAVKWGDLTTRVTGGKVNSISNPADPPLFNTGSIAAADRDAETAADPAWQGAAADKHISTAVIRNAPMRSPWELGFIHRGLPFQTINLKKAGGIGNTATGADTALSDSAHAASAFANWTEVTGTKYANGDAGILDQIKMTEYNKSYGKVDFSALRAGTPDWWVPAASGGSVTPAADLNRALFQGLFENLRLQTPAEFLDESENTNTVPTAAGTGTKLTVGGSSNPVSTAFDTTALPLKILRSQLLNEDVVKEIFVDPAKTNDAAQEELIGKTFNLVEAESCSMPNVFRIVVVTQTIRDLSGNIARVKKDESTVLASAADGLGSGNEANIGKFDANIGATLDDSIYFDEILSECRMLVTVEKIHYMEGNNPRARLRVKQIEYLD